MFDFWVIKRLAFDCKGYINMVGFFFILGGFDFSYSDYSLFASLHVQVAFDFTCKSIFLCCQNVAFLPHFLSISTTYFLNQR